MLKKMGLLKSETKREGKKGIVEKEVGKKRANAEGSDVQVLLTCVG